MPRQSEAMIDMPRKCGGTVIHYLVRCEVCGHQARVGAVVIGNRTPRFVCSSCGDCEPIVDIERR